MSHDRYEEHVLSVKWDCGPWIVAWWPTFQVGFYASKSNQMRIPPGGPVEKVVFLGSGV